MLTNSKATAMLPVVEMARARKFYEEVLGLKAALTRPSGEPVYQTSGTSFSLDQRANPTRADHTALTFEVNDIAGEVKALRARGVRFEEYDLPGLKTVDGVAVKGAERAAWFHDTEGNILCIHQDG